MAKKGRKKETPEERAEWQRNHDQLQRLFEKRLEQEGVTKEEPSAVCARTSKRYAATDRSTAPAAASPRHTTSIEFPSGS